MGFDDRSETSKLASKIEIYKIFVDTAERSIERRMRVNQFYLSIVTAIFIAYSYLIEGKLKDTAGVTHKILGSSRSSVLTALPLWVLPLVLVIISMSWYSVLLSFRALSAAKYQVITEMEKGLPLTPFLNEWKQYKIRRGIEITQLEVAVPVIFYLAGLAGVIVPFLWSRYN